jgi:protein O-mannosyl-transferase
VDSAAKRIGANMPQLIQANALHLSLAIALIWTIHPLQTESVTYVVQRAESLMGLFFLLTFYCFIRANEPLAHARSHEATRSHDDARSHKVERVVPNALGREREQFCGREREQFCGRERERVGWHVLSVLCCLLGMASKEVMASAPIMVLLYDRTFVAGGFRSAWKQRKRFYLALAATWLLLAWLMFGEHGRQQLGIGFGLGVSAWDYLLTQCRAIAIYLKLCFWPHQLVMDYGYQLNHRLSDVLLPAVGLWALLVAAAVGLWKRPVLGFLGAWFFLILAPSSSVVPVITQTIAEHRMYLPLAAVVTLAVLMLQRLLGRLVLPALLTLVAVFGLLTFQRSETYRTEEGIWRDAIAKRPNNERAHHNLGVVLADAGRTAESVTEYEEALRLDPNYTDAHYNLGNALRIEGRTADAIAQYEEALRLKPDYTEARDNLGLALSAEGRNADAIAQYEEALRLKPDDAEAHNDLGNALSVEGWTADAIAQYEEALHLKPDIAAIHLNLAFALLKIPGRADEAVTQLKAVLRLQPDNERARQILDRIEPTEP